MRRIAHISDLHFGGHDERVTPALGEALVRSAPDVIAVSGDLTQRARRREFARAHEFLDQFHVPVVVVPGNHDVPLWNLWARFRRPLARYQDLIARDLAPFHVDDEIAMLGINTARSFTFQGGRVSHEQIALIARCFHEVERTHFKVLVCHHPFVPHPRYGHLGGLGRAALALATLETVGAELLLTGHLHVGFSGDVTAHYPAIRRSMLVMQAGTASSIRLRGEPNAFNLITIDPPRLHCEARGFDGATFTTLATTEYVFDAGRWRLTGAQV